MTHEASVVVFVAQIVALLIAGRVVGELMQRIGQPAVMGQILAGVVLGPSVLGTVAPGLWHELFPSAAEQKAMLDAVAQLGILLLLLMTGLETDLAVFREARRPALSISIAGIAVPFICGAALGAYLPESMLPSPGRRVITALFLGTALSISSVKIVALVVRDLGFVRRTVGQVIIASSILDDTIGWLIVSLTLGLALHGSIDFASVTRSLLGTALFLILSFTVGRHRDRRRARFGHQRDRGAPRPGRLRRRRARRPVPNPDRSRGRAAAGTHRRAVHARLFRVRGTCHRPEGACQARIPRTDGRDHPAGERRQVCRRVSRGTHRRGGLRHERARLD
jgi:hypothetical protein